MASHGSMRKEGPGFWRSTGVVLTCASLAALVYLLQGRMDDLTSFTRTPVPAASIPADTASRARLAVELAPSPAPETVQTLWRLAFDPNHFVRGQALEALARAGEGTRLDPRRAERMRNTAFDDTDWNRRSACVLLLQWDPLAALPLVERLWTTTKNPNTKAALAEALRAADRPALRAELTRRDSPLLKPVFGKP